MLRIKIIPPIVENENFQIDDCHGFSMSNKGNSIVYIDDDFTIEPGQTWSISSSNDACNSNCKICQFFNIRFSSVAIDAFPLSKRLEIVILKSYNE
jgi:coenzyme F420-reducing hydrogenase beta subunit